MKMKNLIMGTGILFLAISSRSIGQVPASQETNPKMNMSVSDTVITPPENIQASFTTRYPKATNIKWYQYNSKTVPIDWDLAGWPALTNRDYAVVYEVDNVPYYAWYDWQGNWVGSTSVMKDFAGLPAPVSKMLSGKYPGYSIKDVHTESYKDMAAYQLELTKGGDKVKLVVDANGNVLKQKTKTVDAKGNETKEKVKIQDK
jgi:hypothetical protein